MPKRSITSISTRVSMVFKNCSQGLPLKFQGTSFGAIKIFWVKFCIGSLAESRPEITIMVNAGRVFKPDSTYMTCFWCSVVTEITVTRVLALKCQKKVRALNRKKAQLLKSLWILTHIKAQKRWKQFFLWYSYMVNSCIYFNITYYYNL